MGKEGPSKVKAAEAKTRLVARQSYHVTGERGPGIPLPPSSARKSRPGAAQRLGLAVSTKACDSGEFSPYKRHASKQEPQRGGDRGDDETLIPGQGFFGR